MKNWVKAFLLTSLFYLLVLLLLFQAHLPIPKETKHTPLSLSMFQEPPAPAVTPQKDSQTITKSPKKKRIERREKIAPSITDSRRPIHKSDANVSVMDSKEMARTKQSIPSLTALNSLFTRPKHKSAPKSDLKNLYGDTFDKLTDEQVEYLDSNLGRIGWITQKYLEFPTLAGELGMHGESILEFDLYPNGDISKIKLLKSSGYALLDDNAVETVEVAYKEYPHPQEKTTIRLLVKYIIEY